MVPGHEFAGRGRRGLGTRGHRGLKVGDQVAVDPLAVLQRVPASAAAGRNNLCERWAGDRRRPCRAARPSSRWLPVANCVTAARARGRTEDAALIEPLSCAVRGYDVLKSAGSAPMC
ncbi:hypothetical protein ACRAWF_35105 [Streptomyces sp. L7]